MFLGFYLQRIVTPAVEIGQLHLINLMSSKSRETNWITPYQITLKSNFSVALVFLNLFINIFHL